MKILVTGLHGQLGQEVTRQFQDKYELALFNRSSLDIRDFNAVESLIFDTEPDVVINAAAYTNVEKAEEDSATAFRVNAIGAQNLALACKKVGSKFVHISTDYIFDGSKTEPYEEFDAPNPLSVYGKSKWWGEKLIEQVGGKYFILRTSWLYGDGPNFVRTMLRLAAERDKLTVVADQYGTPTSTKDLVWVIEKLMATDFYGVYHASNNGSCTWYEFAQEIFKLAGKEVIVEPVSTDSYPVKAKRPQHSVLENRMLKLRGLDVMRPWEDALRDYIENDIKLAKI